MVWILSRILKAKYSQAFFISNCRRTFSGNRSGNVHKAAQPRGCDSVTVFESLPGLTLHNSRIKHSGFLVPVTQRQAGYVTRRGAVTMTQSCLQHTVSALSDDAKTGHTDIKGGALLNEPKASVYSKLQPLLQAIERFWGRRGSAARFQTAVQAPLASMSMGIRVTSLKFSVHYIGLSCSFVSAQSRTSQFNHSMTISWLQKPQLIVKKILNKQKEQLLFND